MSHSTRFLALLASLALPACPLSAQDEETAPVLEAPVPPPGERAALLVSSAAFMFKDRVAGAGGNAVFSPYALYTSFSMAYEGARGATAGEFRSAFGFAEASGTARTEYYAARRAASKALKDLEFVNACAFWYQKGYELDQELEELLKRGYAAAPQTSDFRSAPGRAVTDINSWLAKRTKNSVKGLFPPEAFDRMTRVVLANGVSFKGAWRYGFEGEPAEAEFELADGSTVPVPSVTGGPWPLGYYADEEISVAALDHAGGKVRTLLLLPAEGGGARDLLRNLNAETLEALRGALRVPSGWLQVRLPLIKVQSAWDLARELAPLGLTTSFTPEADYSGLTGRRELVLQKAMQGTALEFAVEGGPAPKPGKKKRRGRPVTFSADRPFVFVVEEKATGLILFIGLVETPKA